MNESVEKRSFHLMKTIGFIGVVVGIIAGLIAIYTFVFEKPQPGVRLTKDAILGERINENMIKVGPDDGQSFIKTEEDVIGSCVAINKLKKGSQLTLENIGPCSEKE